MHLHLAFPHQDGVLSQVGMTTDSTSTSTPVGSDILPGPGRASQAQSRIKASRAETLAALSTELDAPATAAKVEPAPTPMVADEPDSAVEADEDDAPPPPKVESKPDSETSKRLAAVQAAEKRSREKVAAERAEVASERASAAKERAELDAELAELAAYRKAVERAKVDPVGALRAMGITDPADLEHAAKTSYAAAKGDPANKEAAARAMREREHADELATLRKRLDERDSADKQRTETEHVQRETAKYVADLKAAVSDETPIVKHFLAKNPAKTEAALRRTAYELSQETGDIPDHADVLARYEQNRRAELEELGLDPNSILSAPSKKPDPEAAKKPAAKTLNNTLSTPRVPRSKSSEREQRAETLAMLESGKLE